ncbi:MAG: hypothetical protein LDL50_01120 [Chloroflexi bacterium]|nr:hypothetical protein [Chloroflexota bacterium]MCA2001866.1 hypothetical protein [Chloroflexota bacterium]
MKTELSSPLEKFRSGAAPQHASYQLHRKQRNIQILLPTLLSALALAGMAALISFAAFQGDGDVGRWAAVSVIWLATPVLIAGLVTLAVLVGLIYAMSRALNALPRYTGVAQEYAALARGYIIRGANMVVKPVIAVEGFIGLIKAFFERIGAP